MRPWYRLSPHALWLRRSSGARPAVSSVITFAILAAGAALADARGYFSNGSYTLALFIAMTAAPLAASAVARLNGNGQLNLLRLSGVRDTSLLIDVCAGLLAPPLGMSGIFLLAGMAAGVISAPQLALLSVALGLSMTIAAASMLLLRTRLFAVVLGSLIVIGGAGAVVVTQAGHESWYAWAAHPLVWLAATVIEGLVIFALVPGMNRALRRPVEGRGSSRPRRGFQWLPLPRSPFLMRGFEQSVPGALWSLGLSTVIIAAIRFLGDEPREALIAGASFAAYFPLALAIWTTFNQCRLDAESGRLQLIRCAPIPVGRSAILTIVSICLPFVLATCLTSGVVWLLMGAGPKLPLVAVLVIVMLAPAAASEAWLIPSKVHGMGLITGVLFAFVFEAADSRPGDLPQIGLLIGWVPAAAAIATLRSPARPVLGPWVATAAVAATTFLALQWTFGPTIHPKSAFVLTAGLLLAAPRLDVNEPGLRRYALTAAIAAAGLTVMVLRPTAWVPGLSIILLVAVGLRAGGHLARRWPGEAGLTIGICIAGTLMTGGGLLLDFSLGRSQYTPSAFATIVSLTAAALIIITIAAADVAAAITARRHPDERSAS